MRRIHRRACMLVVLIGLLGVTQAARSETLENIPPTPHYAPAESSPDAIARAIKRAASKLGWNAIEESPGALTLSILVRARHEATIKVGYDSSNFWIDYVDSRNLGFDPKDVTRLRRGKRVVITKGPRIHRNYNKWVRILSDRIRQTTRKTIELRERRPSPSLDSALIADEIEKLEALKERGAVTQEEFERRKARLLAR